MRVLFGRGMEEYEPVKTYPALLRKRGHKQRLGEGHHEHDNAEICAFTSQQSNEIIEFASK
jgi:hypothetical protein